MTRISSPLENKIRSLINMHGPLSIDQFMETALTDPGHGYYSSKSHIFGKEGDFITAPEISQLFGEMVGMWLAQHWLKLPSIPDKCHLVELGGGRGTLLNDLLRSTKKLNAFHQSLNIHFVECNQELQKLQQQVATNFDITHYTYNDLKDISFNKNEPVYFIANEFFDALPIKQYIKKNDQLWHEIKIGYNNDQLQLVDVISGFDSNNSAIPKDGILETSPISCQYIENIGNVIANNGGAALIIDYGYHRKLYPALYKSTLQAIQSHQYVDILHDIGNSDLTAHVNFEDLYQSIAGIQGLETKSLITQKEFLLNMGIQIRLQTLISNLNKNNQLQLVANKGSNTSPYQSSKQLHSQYQRLVEDMGQLFKVMEIIAS